MKKTLLPALLLAVSTAHAAEGYLGVGLGISTVSGLSEQDFRDNLDDGSLTSVSTDDEDTAFKLFGGAILNENLAVEAAYADLGEFTASATSSGGIFYLPGSVDYSGEGKALSVALKGILPVNDNVSLFAKLGFARWSVEEVLTNDGFTVAEAEDDGTDPLIGIGASFNVSPKMAIHLEIERYTEVLEEDVDVFGAGLAFRL